MTVTAVELARSKIIPVEFWVLESTTDTVLAKFQSLYEMVFK